MPALVLFFFELDDKYYPKVSYKKDIDSHLKSKVANTKLKTVISVYRKNLYHIQKL